MFSRMMLALMMTLAPALAAQQGVGSTEPQPRPQAKAEAKPDAEAQPEADKATGVQFLTDLAEAKKQAAEAKKRIFIVFSTTWCGPCKKLAADVWSDAGFAETLAKNFVALKIDGDAQKEATRSFGVTAYPTILLTEADGSVVCTQVGTDKRFTPAAWILWLDEQLNSGSKLAGLKAATDSKPEDAAAWSAYADALFELGRKQEAAEAYTKAESLLDEQALHVKVRKAQLLLAQMKDDPTCREVLEELLPKLIKRKDERAIDLSLDFANIVGRLAKEKDPKRSRQMMLDLIAAFPESPRLIELRCRAGMYAHLSGDNETALAEMKQAAEDFKDSTDETTKIWVDRCKRFIATLEKGEKYR